MKKQICILLCLAFAVCRLQAQTAVPVSLAGYLERVRSGNLAFAAEQLNVGLADAAIESAKVFNDPQLSFSYFNNEMHRKQMGLGGALELSKTFSVGKRRAAIDLSRSEKELSLALFDDYFRNLRAEAALAYFEAQKQTMLCQASHRAYALVLQLAQADSIRLASGKIDRVNALQSRLEAGIRYNDLLQAEADRLNTLADLGALTGTPVLDTLWIPQSPLTPPEREFPLDRLVKEALDNRADLAAALKNTEVARREIKVARRERNTDFDLSVGVERSGRVHNEEAPAPPFTGITAGIAVPLRFSNMYKGDLRAARIRAQQADTEYREAELQVQTEVVKSHRQFTTVMRQLKNYDAGLMEQARAVVEGKSYSYERGETSLLEVLDAQRTFNEVQNRYYETLYNYMAALVELERSAGIWDIR